MKTCSQRALAMATVVTLTSCAVVATKGEYSAYRAAKVAESEVQGFRAQRAYLDAYPEGQWAEEFREELAGAERALYEGQAQGRAGLELYLTLFPQGTFANQARSRLAALAAVESQAAAEGAAQAALKGQRQAREEELRRTWLSRFVADWLRMFAGLSAWDATLAQTATDNPEFSSAFGRAPRPRCSQQECIKDYTAHYAIPVPGATRLERTAQLLVRLRLEDGRLVRAELLLPGWGFSRWYELEQGRLVVDSVPEDRATAVDWAREKVGPMLGDFGALSPLADDAALSPNTPALSPSGVLLDTTSPSPAQAVPLQTALKPAEGQVERSSMLAAPDAQEEDLTLSPIQIGPDGEVIQRTDSESGAASDSSEKATITELPEAESPLADAAMTAFQAGNLRIAIVAAPAVGMGHALDGIVIESRAAAAQSVDKR